MGVIFFFFFWMNAWVSIIIIIIKMSFIAIFGIWPIIKLLIIFTPLLMFGHSKKLSLLSATI